MLTPDLSILEEVLLVQLVARRVCGGRVISGRTRKALLIALWATEGSPVDHPSLAVAAGLERAQACYAAQVLLAEGLITRRRAPHQDGRGGGVPMVYAIVRGRLARFRGQWPRGRWPRPGLEGLGAPPSGTFRRACEVRDEELRAAGIDPRDLSRPGAGPWVACRRRIVSRLVAEEVRRWLSFRQVGELLGIGRQPASRLVREVEAAARTRKARAAA